MRKILCELISDGQEYYIGDIVKLENNCVYDLKYPYKVRHVPTGGKDFKDIPWTKDMGRIVTVPQDDVAEVTFCLYCPWHEDEIITSGTK